MADLSRILESLPPIDGTVNSDDPFEFVQEAARLCAKSDPERAWFLLGVAHGLIGDDSASTHTQYRRGYAAAEGAINRKPQPPEEGVRSLPESYKLALAVDALLTQARSETENVDKLDPMSTLLCVDAMIQAASKLMDDLLAETA